MATFIRVEELMRGMKWVLCVPFVIGLSFVPRSSSAQSVQISSLDDAVKIGLERNLTIKEAAKQVEASEAGVSRATWLFLPKAGVEFAATKRQATFEVPASLGLTLAKDPGFFFGYLDDWSMRIRVDQPIFTGGGDVNSLRIARLERDIQQESLSMRRQDLRVEIARAYYGVLLAQQVVKIKEDLLAQNKRHQDDVARRFAAGDVARFDKLRADVQLANITPDVIRARNSVDVAMAQLRNVLDLPRDQPLVVTGAIDYKPEDTSRTDAFAQAMQRRPEIRISRLNREATERQVGVTHARWFPQVGAFFAQDYRADVIHSLFEPRQSNWAAGITFGYSLDIGETLYKGRAEQRLAEQRELAVAAAQRNIEVEVTQAVLELKRATEVIESQRQNVRQAEEAMQIANTSYGSGSITNLELMDTQLALDQARINYVTAVYDYLIGLEQYHRAIGPS